MVKYLKDQTSSHACTALFKCFELQGLQHRLISDNGPCFRYLEFKEFCARRNIVHMKVSPYQHQVDGVAERMIQTVKAFIRKAWSPEGLSLALLDYRSTLLDANTQAPCVLLNNHPFRTTLPSISLGHLSDETHIILADRNTFMARQFNSKLSVKVNASCHLWKTL